MPPEQGEQQGASRMNLNSMQPIEQVQSLRQGLRGDSSGGFSVGDGTVAVTLAQGRTQARAKEVDKVALTNQANKNCHGRVAFQECPKENATD